MISNVSSNVNFSGLWAPITSYKYEDGAYNINKLIVSLKNAVYHPYVGESSEEIAKNVNVQSAGRSFSLWDKFDNHHKADYYIINRVHIGTPIDPNKKDVFIREGYSEVYNDFPLTDKEFYDTWNNATYATFDVKNLKPEKIENLFARFFSKVKD